MAADVLFGNFLAFESSEIRELVERGYEQYFQRLKEKVSLRRKLLQKNLEVAGNGRGL